MSVNRMGYIVYYKGKRPLKRLERMNVNITYVSNKMNYAIFFGEENLEKQYFENLKKIKGFIKLEKSSIYNEEANFPLNVDEIVEK